MGGEKRKMKKVRGRNHFCEVEGKALRQEEEQWLAEAQEAAQGRPVEGWIQGGREGGRRGGQGMTAESWALN